jgi:hypothetical protein
MTSANSLVEFIFVLGGSRDPAAIPAPVMVASMENTEGGRMRHLPMVRKLCTPKTWEALTSTNVIYDGPLCVGLKPSTTDPRFIAGVGLPHFSVRTLDLDHLLDQVLQDFQATVVPTMVGTMAENQCTKKCAPIFQRALANSTLVEDKVATVKAQVEAVTGVMQGAIASALVRGAGLDSLEENTRRLRDTSNLFEHTAGRLRRHIQRRNWKVIFLTTLAVAIVIGIISVVVAGMTKA